MNIRSAFAATVLFLFPWEANLAQDRVEWTHPNETRAAAGARLSPRQMVEMGVDYLDSRPTRARYWLAKPAEQGYAEAQFNLGLVECHLKNYEACVHWHLRAGEQGYIDSGLHLAQMYFDGHRGVPKDFNRACLWSLVYRLEIEGSVKLCQDALPRAEFAQLQRKAREIRGRSRKMKRLE